MVTPYKQIHLANMALCHTRMKSMYLENSKMKTFRNSSMSKVALQAPVKMYLVKWTTEENSYDTQKRPLFNF